MPGRFRLIVLGGPAEDVLHALDLSLPVWEPGPALRDLESVILAAAVH
jgi:hypothetical protein